MLFLVRHGQTVENAAGLVQGQMPGNLSDAGREEVRDLAASFVEESFDTVYSSDLLRAMETAGIIVKRLRCSGPLTDKRIREQNFGAHEGKSMFRLLRKLREERVDISEFIPDKGENPGDFLLRVREFYDECLLPVMDRSNILVVTHYGVIRTLMKDVLGLGAMKEKIRNASCLKIGRGNDGIFRVMD